VLLLLNPAITPGRRDLPLELFETELHMGGGQGAQFTFVRANFAVEVRGRWAGGRRVGAPGDTD
jgi:hypothetical protein